MTSINLMKNNCTLVAVREVCRLPDADIFTAFRKHGYKDNKGLPNYQWIKAAKELGLVMEEVGTRIEGKAYTNYGAVHQTLSQFLKLYPTGVYFVSVNSHALVVRDGKVVDHNKRDSLGLRRPVYFAHRVLNAPAVAPVELSPYLMIPRWRAKSANSESGKRFRDAAVYLARNSNVTAENLIKNSTYTLADLNHDLKKGLIVYQPQEPK